MKFGKTLEQMIAHIPIHYYYFVDFYAIKQIVKQMKHEKAEGRRLSSEELNKDFVAEINSQIEKVYLYVKLRAGELTMTSQDLLAAAKKSGSVSEAQKERADSVARDVVHLGTYITVCKLAIDKIVKKHDKIENGTPFGPYLYFYMENYPFHRQSFDQVILALSDFYALYRGESALSKVAVGTSFTRESVKYWVHPMDVMTVINLVIQHLPVYTFGGASGERVASSPIQSVYFDSQDLHMYHKRIEHLEGAALVRIRWYGDNDKDLFVERKIHHDKWVGEASTKERFLMKSKNIDRYLSGKLTLDEYTAWLKKKDTKEKDLKQMSDLFEEVRGRVTENKLIPSVRTTYSRLAFQIPGDASLRISLDTLVCMSTESRAQYPHWRSEDPEREMTYDFPYGILEVKLQTDHVPEWVNELKALVEAVPKFSKFGHGCNVLLKDKIRVEPYWMHQMATEIGSHALGVPGTEGLVRLPKSNTPSHYDPVYFLGKPRSSVRGRAISPTRVPGLSGGEHTAHTSLGRPRSPQPILERRSSQDVVVNMKHVEERATSSTSQLGKPQSELRARKTDDDKGKPTENTPLIAKKPPVLASPAPKPAKLEKDDDCSAFMSLFWKKKDVAQNGKVIKVPMRIEPKTYFANERTFLHWLNISILLGTMTLGSLRNQSSSLFLRGLSIFFAFVTVFFMLYALAVYYGRAAKINRGKAARFDDPRGPVVLVVCLIAAFAVSIFNYASLGETKPKL